MPKESPPDTTTIGGRLRAERERMRLSVADMAGIAGITKENMAGWERSNSTQADALTRLGKSGLDILYVVTGTTTPETLAGVTIEEAMAILSPEKRHHLFVYLLTREFRSLRKGGK